MVRFLTFEQFHGKKGIGSTNIRVHQVIKYWDEAELYKYGENPDVIIFQKVYWLPDYTFPVDFEGIKILDICDPDWLDNANIKRTVDGMDAVAVPSKAIQQFIQQLTDKPVRIIKDKFDLENVPKLKKHTNDGALNAVWFGYHHNAEVLSRGAVRELERNNISLTIISNDDPFAWRWAENEETFKQHYHYIKYNEESIYEHLRKSDICILPEDTRPQGKFKSNNKTVKAMLAGLPVIKDADTLHECLDKDARNKIAEYNYNKAIKEYDVKLSVAKYKDLIAEATRLRGEIRGE